MSEERAAYRIGAAALRPATLLKYNDPGYEAANDTDVRALKDISGKTGGELSEICGVDARTFRAWSAPQSAERRQRIPYAAWRLLLIELGLVNCVV